MVGVVLGAVLSRVAAVAVVPVRKGALVAGALWMGAAGLAAGVVPSTGAVAQWVGLDLRVGAVALVLGVAP
ncbi:hypothetical protein [Alloactinosynnema sp. L-07]|nr:hypothetical protein [Alloactinosynnema sp. L-07]